MFTRNPNKVYYPATAWYALAAEFFVIDRVLKCIAMRSDGATAADAAPGWFDFVLFKNTGIAFSLPVPPLIYWPIALMVFGVLTVMFLKNVRTNYVRAGMLFAVLLGAISNLYDRATYGWTTDYWLIFQRSAINLADVMIVCGLLALAWHTSPKHDKTAGKNAVPVM